MTTVINGKNSFFLNTPAILVQDEVDVASTWATEHIIENPAIKWIVANYVEADNANNNSQYWTLDDLRIAKPSIAHTPMNIDHKRNIVVGAWTAAELLYPTDSASTGTMNPYIESVGAFWQHYFPEYLEKVENAFNTGQLYVSMECIAESVTCTGTDVACDKTFPYKGPFDSTYCSHINDMASYKQFNKTQFRGGALIMPGNKPGWKNAFVNDVATQQEVDRIVESIANDNPEGTEEQWVGTMNQLLYRATLEKFSRVS